MRRGKESIQESGFGSQNFEVGRYAAAVLRGPPSAPAQPSTPVRDDKAGGWEGWEEN